MAVKLFHLLVGMVGLLLLYAGVFLTETEEGGLENRLEDLWIRVDDYQSRAINRQAALLQQVSGLSAEGMEKLLGQKLFSLKSLASCWCFAVASLNLSLAWFVTESDAFPRWATLIASLFFVICGFSRKLRYFGLGLTILGAVLSVIGLWVFRQYQLSSEDAFFGMLSIGLGMLAVVGSVALTRWSLSVASRTSNAAGLVGIVLANVFLAIGIVSPLLSRLPELHLEHVMQRLSSRFPPKAWGYLFAASGTTLFAAALALVVVFVLFSALVHRMLWPAISRIIYAAHRHGLVQPRWLRVLGCACLVMAWPNNIAVRAISKALHMDG